MCLGDIVQKVINILTFGTGKTIAEKIANKLGFESCGCSERQQWLNKVSGCKKNIRLN